MPSFVMFITPTSTKTRIFTIAYRAFSHLLILPLLLACATNPVTLPDWDIEKASIEAQSPLTLPVLPQAGISGDLATFDKAAMEQLQRYVITSEGNVEIAQANAEALKSQSQAYNSLIDAGRMQQQISQIRQQLLDEEKKAHFVDNLWHRGVIILGVLAAVL